MIRWNRGKLSAIADLRHHRGIPLLEAKSIVENLESFVYPATIKVAIQKGAGLDDAGAIVDKFIIEKQISDREGLVRAGLLPEHGTELPPLKWFTNMKAISQAYDIRECLAFGVDPRFVPTRDGWEGRIGVHYGVNITAPSEEGVLIPPPVVEGEFVFGVHLLSVDPQRRISIQDRWHDAARATRAADIFDAKQQIRTYLAEIDDEKYLRMAKFYGDPDELHRSSIFELQEFEGIVVYRE